MENKRMLRVGIDGMGGMGRLYYKTLRTFRIVPLRLSRHGLFHRNKVIFACIPIFRICSRRKNWMSCASVRRRICTPPTLWPRLREASIRSWKSRWRSMKAKRPRSIDRQMNQAYSFWPPMLCALPMRAKYCVALSIARNTAALRTRASRGSPRRRFGARIAGRSTKAKAA